MSGGADISILILVYCGNLLSFTCSFHVWPKSLPSSPSFRLFISYEFQVITEFDECFGLLTQEHWFILSFTGYQPLYLILFLFCRSFWSISLALLLGLGCLICKSLWIQGYANWTNQNVKMPFTVNYKERKKNPPLNRNDWDESTAHFTWI